MPMGARKYKAREGNITEDMGLLMVLGKWFIEIAYILVRLICSYIKNLLMIVRLLIMLKTVKTTLVLSNRNTAHLWVP